MLRKLLFALYQLVLGHDVVVDELLYLDIPVVILVTLAEKLVNNLAAVVLVDALLRQKHQHLIFVDVTVPVDVDCSELVIELSLLLLLIRSKL